MKTIALLLAVTSALCLRLAVADSQAAGSRCPSTISDCISTVSREAWGARNPIATRDFPCFPSYVVIIHTETPECFDDSSCIARLEFMQRLHMDDYGWDDLGYNFVIGGNGVVYDGTGWDEVGTHSGKYNSDSISIAFIGNFENHLPSPAALDAAHKLIACGLAKRKIPRDYKLVGHKQLIPTKSPGTALFNEIKTWPSWTSTVDY